jgi:O-antigen/teichoic acid export membrane protein
MLPALVGHASPQVGAYLAALSLARLPLFALSPLAVLVVPRIAFAMQAGDVSAGRRVGIFYTGAAFAAGVGIVIVAVGSGPALLRMVFGPEFSIQPASVAAVAIASGCWLAAAAATGAATAVGRPALPAIGWTAGLLIALLVAALSGFEPQRRTDAAIAAGALVAGLGTGLAAIVSLRTNRGSPGVRRRRSPTALA